MICNFGTDDWRKCTEWEMDTWIWHQVGLKFCQIDVQCAIKSQRCGDREIHCANKRFKFVYVGRSIPKFLLQISYRASSSTMNATSECSIIACAHNTELYGSTTAVAICGDG